MKAVIVQAKSDFVRFDLVITIESEAEGQQILRQLDNVCRGDYLTAANVLRKELTRQGILGG